jgi:PAS domain S-box-containing protein
MVEKLTKSRIYSLHQILRPERTLGRVRGAQKPTRDGPDKIRNPGGLMADEQTQSVLLTELRKLLETDTEGQLVPLRELIENLPVAFAYVDSNEIVRVVNKELEKWYAKPKSQLIGRSIREVTGDDERYFIAQKHRHSTLRGYANVWFLPRLYPDGIYRYVAGFLQPDVAADGKVLGYTCVFCAVPLSSDEAKHIFDDRGFRRIGNATSG